MTSSTQHTPRSFAGSLCAAVFLLLIPVGFGLVGWSPSPAYAQDSTPKDAEPSTDSNDAETTPKDAEATPDLKDADPKAQPPAPDPKATAQKPAVPKEAAKGAQLFPSDYDAFQKAYTRYQNEIEDYRKEVDAIVESEYQHKRKQISKVYDKEIKALEILERERRTDAIAAFSAFLKKYPNNPTYTPDVIYRLAELHFEKANDDYLIADERFQADTELYDLGRIPDPPVAPERQYDQSVALFQRLIKDFPDYRFIDGAYYLLGFCYVRSGKDKEAKDAFARLIQKTPKSRFVPEAWVRIGEYHFEYNELDQAIAAYDNALNYTDNPFFDKALYKLAWTYYRADKFGDAIRSFQRLVEYADDQAKKTGRSGSDLREEAIQYLAISLAEEDWDGDSVPDEDFGMTRVNQYMTGDKEYEQEVLASLGDIFFENTRYEQAVDSFQVALEKYPKSEDNPKVHDKMILALMRLRKFDQAFEERRKTGSLYGAGSDWYKFQQKEGNLEAIAFADKLSRDNLIESATWFHEQAQNTGDEARNRQDPEMQKKAVGMYTKAADAYSKYIKKYPQDKEIYKWSYYRAECLFYSLQFADAAVAYASVRDMNLGENKFREPAAFNGIKARENTVKMMIDSGEVPAKALPSGSLKDQAAEDGATETENNAEAGRGTGPQELPEPEALPEVVQKLNDDRMKYVTLGLSSKNDPKLPGKLEFQVAKVYYDFNNIEEARKRFERILDTYPRDQVAAFSAALILQSYINAQDYEKMAFWADKIANNPDLAMGKGMGDIKAEAERLKLGALFKKAEALDDQGKYEEAAEAYISIVNANPQNQYADKALNNAARAYEKVKRFESAMKLYERVFQQYPKSPLAPKALFRVAFNAERFFDFQKAVRSYLLLADRYPEGDQSKSALKRAGILQENNQNYGRAAATFQRFASTYPQDEDSPLTLYQSVLVYEKMKDYPKMIRAFEDFKKRYGSNSKYDREVLQGLDKVADYYMNKARDRKNAKRTFEQIVREHDVRSISPGTFEAQYAAKASFFLAEFQFEEWDKIQFKGSMKAQERLLKSKMEGAQSLQPQYQKVYDYGNLEWTMASGYRSANILQRFAQALFNAEIPFEEGTEEYDVFITAMEDVAIPLEDDAVKDYEKVLAKARQEKIVNEWTKKILEELNKYRPADYPLFHEEKSHLQKIEITPTAPLTPQDLAKPKAEDEEEAPSEGEAPEADSEDGSEEEPDEGDTK